MKTPNDFATQEEWIEFVRANVAPEDIPFTLALGRVKMFQEFYRLRGLPFPQSFSADLEAIQELPEPMRAFQMNSLNDTILGDLVQLLFTAAAIAGDDGDEIYPTTPRKVIEQLLSHLRSKDPYFALWMTYTNTVAAEQNAPEWLDFAAKTLGLDEGGDMEFAALVADLGRCLNLYHAEERALPKHFYFQIWFLYRARNPERNVMTRALVQELLEGLEPCASA